MKLDYSKLKAIGQVVLPAIITMVVTILNEVGCEYTETVTIVLGAMLTCYNSIIVCWNKDYYQAKASEVSEYTSEV